MSAAWRSRRTSRPSSSSTCPAPSGSRAQGPPSPASARASRGELPRRPRPAWSSRRCMPPRDVFVFPSKTDTFGLVLLEAMACGLPVAAYPVTGPLDVIGDSKGGVMHEDLRTACLAALKLKREDAAAHARSSPGARRQNSSSPICTHASGRPIVGAAWPHPARRRSSSPGDGPHRSRILHRRQPQKAAAGSPAPGTPPRTPGADWSSRCARKARFGRS